MLHDYLDLEMRDGVAILWIDQQGATVNTLHRQALTAFDAALDVLAGEAGLRAAVLISRKKETFIAGADIGMLKALTTLEEAQALIREGHRVATRFQTLGKPVVAAIHGAAMGGGLEVALACSYRLATDHPNTRLALPEVKLGLLPGSGGTQRLPRLVGLPDALEMMLTGKTIYPHRARKMGLVDVLVYPEGLLDAALSVARDLASGARSQDHDGRSLGERLIESNPVSRRLVYQQAEARVRKETHGNYPAPPRIIECVRTGMEEGFEAGLQEEVEGFAQLVFTPESQALVGLFLAQQAAGKNPWPDAVRTVETVAMIGAGLMGGGIAEVSVEGGLNVLVKDIDLEHAATARKVVWRDVTKKVEKHILSPFERDLLVERVRPVEAYADLATVDLVIEAVPEKLSLKQQVIRDTEAVTHRDTVFASNTSSIPISAIAETANRPEAVLGMHYFSPVPQMPLLELIRSERTADWALATAFDVGRRQGKTVIVVNDGPGFYTTRILAIYMNEALLLLEEGADVEQVDRAMVQWGFPMGPFALFDLVGIDVGAKITEVMAHYLGRQNNRDMRISEAARKLTDAGYVGQKSGVGFYRYDKAGSSKRAGLNPAIYAYFGGPERRPVDDMAVIQHRLGLVMVNEAVYCLDEGILQSPRDGDLGAVFGLGFPPFRGGPFRFVDQETAPAVMARLSRLQLAHGDRFRAAPRLQTHARTGALFYEGEHAGIPAEEANNSEG